MSPCHATARLWLDPIIDPLDARIPPKRRDRLWVSKGTEAPSRSPAMVR